MFSFATWLIAEDRQELVPPEVLQGYEQEFQKALQQFIQQNPDPAVQQQLRQMLDCPIQDARGQCRKFSEYILSALLRNGIHREYDLEACLAYIFQQMMLDKSLTTGLPRTTLFGGFDPHRTADVQGGLRGRFMTFLKFALNNIRKGKIPRLANVFRYPPGTVSIGQGRGDDQGGVSPDEITARPSDEADLGEMVADVKSLLQHQEAEQGLPLVGLFTAMMHGEPTSQQMQRYGDARVKAMRQVIQQTVRDYAQATGNYRLLTLLHQQANPPIRPATAPAPRLSPKERDYRSIASVVDKFDRPVGTADLGRFRRRWLEYPPRNATSGHRNRLEETLESMVQDKVLQATRTARGAVVYLPGEHFGRFCSQS